MEKDELIKIGFQKNDTSLEITIEKIKEKKFRLKYLINKLTKTDYLPNFIKKNNIFLNFNNKDFTQGNVKKTYEGNNCTIYSRRDIRKNFYGIFIFVRNLDPKNFAHANFLIRTKYTRENLKERLKCSSKILDKYLQNVSLDEITIINENSFNIEELLPDELEWYKSMTDHRLIFYNFSVLQSLLNNESFINECVNYENRKNKSRNISRRQYFWTENPDNEKGLWSVGDEPSYEVDPILLNELEELDD